MEGESPQEMERRGVFVSYTKRDLAIAEWIAWELEEHGFPVTFQAWGDLSGNWILAMDHAMKTSTRTVAVVSDAYLESLYGAPEWANAARLDPTGELDLLVPVRVQELTTNLSGWLAQIPYVDFVGKAENVCRELLIGRLEHRRSKPSQAPAFPLVAVPTAVTHTAVVTRPVFPAQVEDDTYWEHVRELLTAWRAKYALRLQEARDDADQARMLQRSPPPVVDQAVRDMLCRAAVAADDLRSLPVSGLDRCTAHGLRLHGAVVHGAALSQAQWAAETALEDPSDIIGLSVDAYGYENAARVLDAAIALAEYDIGRLPHGYQEPATPALVVPIPSTHPVVVVRREDSGVLELVAVGDSGELLGTFIARGIPLQCHCARLNDDGTVDIVGSDANHLYCWWGSGQRPATEFRFDRYVLASAFAGDDHEQFVVVTSDGTIETLNIDRGRKPIETIPVEGRLSDVAIWTTPSSSWGLVARSTAEDVHSWTSGQSQVSTRSGNDLWQQTHFGISQNEPFLWNHAGSVQMATVDGFPCAVVERKSMRGSGIWFLEPQTLEPLRSPIMIRGRVSAIAVALGRWLVTAHLVEGDRGMSLWDLRQSCATPTATALPVIHGDVYLPIVIDTGEHGEFTTLQIHQEVAEPWPPARLVRCRWPAGNTDVVAIAQGLTAWPIQRSHQRRSV